MGTKRNSGTIHTPRGIAQGKVLVDPKTGNPLKTSLDGSLSISIAQEVSDAFGRLRTSSVFGIFDNKNIFNKNDNFWEEDINGGGASISYLSNEASVSLDIGTANGEYAIRQTSRYFSYIPGKSQAITMTFVMGDFKDNLVRRVGYFDDNDGLFLEQNGQDLNIAIRTSTSGSPVDNQISQDDWNLDKLDGSGISQIKLDVTKAQILLIDFQWLGVGKIRFGFNIDGNIIYCHEVENANNIDQVYMSTPSLPLRYEIRNSAVTSGVSNLKEICSSVASEGGYLLPGLQYSVANGITTRSVGTTRTPVLAIRLKNSFNGSDNRRTLRYLEMDSFAETENVFFEIAHLNTPSSITATWSDVGGGSASEYSTDITIVTGNPEKVIDSSIVAAGAQGSLADPSASSSDIGFVNEHSFVSQNKDSNNSSMIVIYATAFTGTATVSTSVNWIEFD